MTNVFMTVLNMSITAGFVIAALYLVRLVLQKIRAPKWISYALWAVAGFRLAVPFTLESVWSLIPRDIPEVTAPPRVFVDVPPLTGTPEWAKWAISSDHAAYSKPVWSAFDTLAVVWLIGVAAMLIYAVVSYVRLVRRRDSVTTPFVYGFIKPQIHIPSGLAGDELRYVTLHEQTHVKRRDYLVKLFAFALLCVHWFNPLAWIAFVLLCADMEMSCDERVLRELGMDTKADYSQTLLSLSMNRRIISASPLAFGEGGIKERVKNVLKFKKTSRVIVIAAVALVVVLSVCFAVNRESIIRLPNAVDVLSITMNRHLNHTPVGEAIITDNVDINYILDTLSGSERTLKKSVDDYPNHSDYLVAQIHLENSVRTLYLYGGYIEEPYIGIYRLKSPNDMYGFFNDRLAEISRLNENIADLNNDDVP